MTCQALRHPRSQCSSNRSCGQLSGGWQGERSPQPLQGGGTQLFPHHREHPLGPILSPHPGLSHPMGGGLARSLLPPALRSVFEAQGAKPTSLALQAGVGGPVVAGAVVVGHLWRGQGALREEGAEGLAAGLRSTGVERA